jgi:hypothetical protein
MWSVACWAASGAIGEWDALEKMGLYTAIPAYNSEWQALSREREYFAQENSTG